MKTLYEAGSAIEAHMLVDLLKQEGLTAHIHGESLQGAVGEIPVSGLVRLVVAEEDHAAARAVIDRWEATQVEPTPRATAAPARKSRGWVGLALGLVIGVGATYAMYRAPARIDGIDYNRDGELDERWTFSPNGMPIKTETDRNLDRKVDYVTHFDARGHIESAESDDNFDGVFESKQWLKNGNVEMTLSDTERRRLSGYALDVHARHPGHHRVHQPCQRQAVAGRALRAWCAEVRRCRHGQRRPARHAYPIHPACRCGVEAATAQVTGDANPMPGLTWPTTRSCSSLTRLIQRRLGHWTASPDPFLSVGGHLPLLWLALFRASDIVDLPEDEDGQSWPYLAKPVVDALALLAAGRRAS